jgi:hypothetical protein
MHNQLEDFYSPVPPFIRDRSLDCNKAAHLCVAMKNQNHEDTEVMWLELYSAFYRVLESHYKSINRKPTPIEEWARSDRRSLEWIQKFGHFDWR